MPPDDLCRAAVDGVPGLLDDAGTDPRNAVLTLARIVATRETGTIYTKHGPPEQWA